MVTDPLIGRMLANYRIDRLIGRGGMASVYYATDIRLNRPAAVKVINPFYHAKESFTSRFIQEASAVAAWRHEHIVQIYHAGEEDGVIYFAMEYIDGTTLAQILSGMAVQGKRLPKPDVLRYGRAIASALDYAHRKGVIHRDVKPLNVMVASDGRVVLTDFGIALDTAQGSVGEVFGTPHYIAPEQARRSNAAVPQSDLYSLGVILFEMLAGALPFDDPSPTSVALQHIVLPPPSPRQINPDLSEAVEAVLLKALSKNPSERFQTGAELMDALEAALRAPATFQISTPVARPSIPSDTSKIAQTAPMPAQPLHKTAKAANRIPWLAVSVVICLLAGAGAAVLYGLRGILNAASMPPTLTFETTAISQNPTSQPEVISSGSPSVVPSPSPGSEPAIAPTETQGSALPLLDTPVSQPTSTQKYAGRRRFMLYYNESSFYMHQLSGSSDLIASVSFERLGADDRLLNSFSGNAWAKFYQSSLVDYCFRVDIIGAKNYLNPPECGERFLATVHLSPENTGIFWTPQEGSQEFRVLWRDEELVRCEIADGSCEVYLP